MNDGWRDVLRSIKQSMTGRKQESLPSKSRNKQSPPLPSNAKRPTTAVRAAAPTTTLPRSPKIEVSSPGVEKAPILPTPEPTATRTRNGGTPINIGLDFGTSSTKICVRKALGLAGNPPSYPIALGKDARGNAAYLCPSTVSIKSGKLYFGFEAESMRSQADATLTHLKVCTACTGTACRQAKSRGCAPLNKKPIFRICGQQIRPRDLVIAYLAWILDETRKKVPQSLYESPDFRITCNLGIPIDWIDADFELNSTYEYIAGIAWKLKGHIRQGISVDTVKSYIAQIEKIKGADAQASSIQICPETTAAVISYANSPKPNLGLYGLVDIGAWTTDISFFKISHNAVTAGVKNLAFYSATTTRVAAGRIDDRLAEFLSEIWGPEEPLPLIDGNDDLAEHLRQRRESDEWNGGSIKWLREERHIPPEAVTTSRLVTAGDLRREFTKALRKAYNMEPYPQEPKWRNFPVILLGGGAHEERFAHFIRNGVPITGEIRQVAYPSIPFEGADSSTIEQISPRLAVAYGLSFPKPLWPSFRPPREVAAPPDAPERVVTSPGDNEPG